MKRIAGLALALVVLLVAPAQAASGGDNSDLIYRIINFVLLIGTLFFLLRKPLRNFFDGRRAEIRGELEEAAALKKDAETRFASWQRKLDELESEIESIRSTARERAETERENLLEDARRSAERIRQDAAAAVDQEVRRAQASLHEEASRLAVELAANILREQVNDQDRDRLLDEFIGRIENAPAAGSQS